MRARFNKFTKGGGAGVLIGIGIWIAEGGLPIPHPTPPSYWVGIGFIGLGVALGIYGLFGKPYKEIKLVDDIKTDLVNMSVIERNTATRISSQIDLPQETVIQIGEDYEAVLGDFLSSLSKFIDVALNKDYDTLIKYFYAVAEILDMNKAGLKFALIDNEQYKASKLDLEQKRLHLKPAKKHKFTQPNIVRVEKLSYGVNSHIILRGIFTKFRDQVKEIPTEIWETLEGIENASETILKAMLDDLEGDWGKEKKK
jgi:hypothetical protein